MESLLRWKDRNILELIVRLQMSCSLKEEGLLIVIRGSQLLKAIIR